MDAETAQVGQTPAASQAAQMTADQAVEATAAQGAAASQAELVTVDQAANEVIPGQAAEVVTAGQSAATAGQTPAKMTANKLGMTNDKPGSQDRLIVAEQTVVERPVPKAIQSDTDLPEADTSTDTRSDMARADIGGGVSEKTASHGSLSSELSRKVLFSYTLPSLLTSDH